MANNLGISKTLNSIISALNVKADVDSVNSIINDITTTINSKAPIANPSFTGTPKSVTATDGDNTTQIATTEFVTTAVANKTSVSGNAGTSTKLAKEVNIALSGDVSGSVAFDGSKAVTITTTVADDSHNHVIGNVDGLQSAIDAKAPIASPSFTGSPTAPNLFETTQDLSGSAIDCSAASTFTKTISADTTFTITGVPASKASTICLLLTNGGSYAVTWPSNVKWPSATVPTLSTGTDLITLFTPNGGTTWYGTLSMTELG